MKRNNGTKAALILVAVGLIIAIAAVCCGATLKNVGFAQEDLTEMYDEFEGELKELDIDIKAGKVTIQRGDTISVKSSRVIERYIGVDFEDGCLKVEEDEWNINKIFSWLPGQHGSYSPEVVITIPKDVTFDKVKVQIGAGQGLIYDLTTEKLDAEVSAGELRGENITVTDKGSLDVKTGAIVMKQFQGEEMELECNVGSIHLTGTLEGRVESSCNVGEIQMNLQQPESVYNYIVDCDLGDVIINDSHYSGVNNTVNRENAGKYRMELKCKMGSIRVITE